MSRKKTHAVSWTDVAEQDLAAIVSAIAVHSLPNAEKVLTRLETLAAGLATYPERGRLVPELEGLSLRFYRELIAKPWRLIYRIDERSVYVLSVVDARRNVEDLLLARFLK